MELDDIYELRQMMGAYFISKESYDIVKEILPSLIKDRNTFETVHLTTNDGGEIEVILGRDTVLLHSTRKVRDSYREFMEKFQEEGQPKVGFRPQTDRRLV